MGTTNTALEKRKRLEAALPKILERRSNGEGLESIAKSLNVSASTLWGFLKRNDVNTTIYPCETSSVLHLSKYIIEMYSAGKGCSTIANKLDVDPQAVTALVKKMGLLRPKLEYQIDHNFFQTIDTEGKAYFLGLLAADGCVIENKDISIDLTETDGYILEQLAKLISPDLPVKVYKQYGEGKMYNGREVIRSKPRARLRWRSKQMAEDLKRWGVIPRKSQVLGPITSKLPKEVRWHFIRGFFDGNGYCITKTKAIGFIGAKEFLEDLKETIGLQAGATYARPGTYCFVYHAKSSIKQIIESLYKDATLFLTRKKDKLVE